MLGFLIKAELDQCAAGSVMRDAIQQKINNKHYKVVGASCMKELERVVFFFFIAACEKCIFSGGNCKRMMGKCERSSKRNLLPSSIPSSHTKKTQKECSYMKTSYSSGHRTTS